MSRVNDITSASRQQALDLEGTHELEVSISQALTTQRWLSMRFDEDHQETMYLKQRFTDERVHLLFMWLGMLVIVFLTMMSELEERGEGSDRYNRNIIILRGGAGCAIFLALLVNHCIDYHRHKQWISCFVFTLVGVALAVNQLWVGTNIESLLSFIPILSFVSVAMTVCKLTIPYTLVYSGITLLVYFGAVFWTARESPDEIGSWTSILLLYVIASMFFKIIYYRRGSEARDRREFRKKYNLRNRVTTMQAETRVLREEYYNMVLEKYEVGEKKFDFESPMDKALRLLQELKLNPHITPEQFFGLENVLAALSTHQSVYAPRLMMRENKVDIQTRAWLKELFFTSGKVGISDVVTPRSDVRRLTQLEDARMYSTSTISEVLHSSDDERAIRQHLHSIDDWNFDVFRLHELSRGRPLYVVGFVLFQRYDLIDKFNIPESCLHNFLESIENGYLDNPYHNSTHAADVAQTIHVLLSCGGDESLVARYLTDVDILAAVLSALIHDFQHPGLSNSYLVSSEDNLATLYNDVSVLENHHLSAAFGVMYREDCAILQNLTKEDKKELRQKVIDLVLSTDLAKHFEILGKFKSRLTLGKYDIGTPEDAFMVMRVMLKAADLSHTSKDRKLHLRWTKGIIEEFFKQGDLEREKGLTISAFMDREDPKIAESQVGFIDFLVMPLFESASGVLTCPLYKDVVLLQLYDNYKYWEAQT